MPIVERADLYYQDNRSDKVYHATLEEENGDYRVCFAYGRRGSALSTGIKVANTTEVAARKVYNKLVSEKTGKGYQHMNGTGPSTTPSAIAVLTEVDDAPLTPRAQLLNPIEEHEALLLLGDPEYFAQPKHDGVRFMLGKEGDSIYALNRRGKRVPVPVEIENTVKTWNTGDFFVDGELVGTTLHIFDILKWEDYEFADMPLSRRLLRLGMFADYYTGARENDYVKHSLTATTAAEKARMFNDLVAGKQEGIVFKRADAPYRTGRPNSGGANLKFKFYDTCSCVVTELNAKRSVALGLYDGSRMVSAGNVTIPSNFTIPQVGQVVEIRYLYARKQSGALYQPVYLGERTDIMQLECTVAQLKYKAGDDEEEDGAVEVVKQKTVVIKDKSPKRVLDLD